MPKGNRKKRTQEEYEKEIDDAVKRMQKRPEHLKSAKNSKAWLEFLDGIGINVESDLKQDFWEKVRGQIKPPPEKADVSIYSWYSVKRKPVVQYRSPSGKFTRAVYTYTWKSPSGKTVVQGRDAKGKFTKYS